MMERDIITIFTYYRAPHREQQRWHILRTYSILYFHFALTYSYALYRHTQVQHFMPIFLILLLHNMEGHFSRARLPYIEAV